VEVRGKEKRDGQMKCGWSEMRLIREIPLPKITTEQRVKYAILCAKQVYSEKKWATWADKWLDGTDRTKMKAMEAAAGAAEAVEWAARAVARAVAGAAAGVAAGAAAGVSAGAATEAAEEAAEAARAAAEEAAEAARAAAEEAAWAARAAARAVAWAARAAARTKQKINLIALAKEAVI
jgi:hypothetical protein